jgi:hypothetical protein
VTQVYVGWLLHEVGEVPTLFRPGTTLTTGHGRLSPVTVYETAEGVQSMVDLFNQRNGYERYTKTRVTWHARMHDD